MIIDRIDEEFLLFALRPDGRWIEPRKGSLDYGLAGAWLAELLVDGYIRMDQDKVVARGHESAGEQTLDWALEKVRSGRPKRVHRAVYQLGKDAQTHRHAVMKRLEGRGHVEVQRANGHYLYPQHNTDGRTNLHDHLRAVIFGQRQADDASVGLLAVLDAAGLVPHVFGPEMTQQGRLLLERLLHRDHRLLQLHDAVRETKGWSLSQLI